MKINGSNERTANQNHMDSGAVYGVLKTDKSVLSSTTVARTTSYDKFASKIRVKNPHQALKMKNNENKQHSSKEFNIGKVTANT